MKKRITALVLALALAFAMTMSVAALAEGDTAPAAFEQTIDWNAEYDVVVVGLGAAGCTTAITAAQQGAKVLVLEKAPEGYAGGNSAVCMQWATGTEDKEGATAYMKGMRSGFATPTDEMIDVYVEGLYQNEQWLKDMGGRNVTRHEFIQYPDMAGAGSVYLLTVDGNMGIVAPGNFKGSGALYKLLKKNVEKLDNVDIWYEAPGKHLIQDPQTKIIHGVQAEIEGQTINVRAKNGVVLACGGYENNPTMLQDYNDLYDSTTLGAAFYNTGDGILMAQEVGASLWHMANILWPSSTYRFDSDVALFVIRTGDGLSLGADGTLYTEIPNMGASNYGKSYFYGNYVQTPYPDVLWAIYDDEIIKTSQFHNSFSEDKQWEIEHGYYKTANTLEELAEVTGMPFDVMKASIETNNATEGAHVVHAPFYAIKITHSVVNTEGGPKRGVGGEIIDVNDNPIPHLYEAGELGDVSSHLYQAGLCIGGALTYGRISGKNAAEPKTDNYQGSVMEGKTPFQPTVIEKTWECAANQYIGKGEGKSTVPMTVRVTKDGDDITAVEILESYETPGLTDRCVEQTIAQIVEKDKPYVDIVSGATMTCVGIMSAVNDALTQAK